jgi:predicted ABC-type exoprotein transport system permease subunit
MAKQIFKMSRDISRAPVQIFRIAAGVLAVLLVMSFAWWFGNKIILAATRSGLNAVLLFALAIIYAVLVERSLAITPLFWKWRYRLAFVLPILGFALACIAP